MGNKSIAKRNNRMENRRSFSRFDTQLKAKYFLKERKESWGKCKVIDVSRKGMGIIFTTREKINVGSTVLLEIDVSTASNPVHVIGILRWIRKKGNDFVGGIESTKILDDVKLYYSPLEK
ncbi:MAG: PilZ domain-containing protein [Deltaproteobacteria bacterium]|nr:PilZ domain-containing protein [Deltaproteobacteria bacterium]